MSGYQASVFDDDPSDHTKGVGRSTRRTPAKHDLMDKLYRREVGAGSRIPQITDHLWLDLTAGDGVPLASDSDWARNCSPGILARHAAWRYAKPVTVRLYERAPVTYRTLLGNLARELGSRGWQHPAENEWRQGRAVVTVWNTSGANADLSGIGPGTAVVINNDPNHVHHWALPPALLDEIETRKPAGLLGINTMGCNVGGLKRFPLEERLPWYAHVQTVVSHLRPWHDLLLATIERDAEQWAYLIPTPRRWCADVEKEAIEAFGIQDLALRYAWWRTDRSGFENLTDLLFLRRSERD